MLGGRFQNSSQESKCHHLINSIASRESKKASRRGLRSAAKAASVDVTSGARSLIAKQAAGKTHIRSGHASRLRARAEPSRYAKAGATSPWNSAHDLSS